MGLQDAEKSGVPCVCRAVLGDSAREGGEFFGVEVVDVFPGVGSGGWGCGGWEMGVGDGGGRWSGSSIIRERGREQNRKG